MSASDDQPLMDTRLGRPYLASRGRTAPRFKLDLATLVQSSGTHRPSQVEPEYSPVLVLCRREPIAVAELAFQMELPVTIVKVIVSDLLTIRAVQAFSPHQFGADASDVPVLEALLRGLHRL